MDLKGVYTLLSYRPEDVGLFGIASDRRPRIPPDRGDLRLGWHANGVLSCHKSYIMGNEARAAQQHPDVCG
jgi:hypothetical protein